MFWDKMLAITKKNHKSISDIIRADEELDGLISDCDIDKYVIVRFNQCVLLDTFMQKGQIGITNDATEKSFIKVKHLFSKHLMELNQCILTSFWDEPDSNEYANFQFAMINFRAQNYEEALKLFEKSIKQEQNKTNYLTNKSVVRMRKRCLKAYCLEYLGLSASNKKNTFLAEERISEAIFYLIGYDVNGNVEEEDIIDNVVFKSMKCTSLNDDICSVLQLLYVEGKNSVFEDLNKFYNDGLLDADDYNYFITDIAHVLAHCLSEIRLIKGSTYKRSHKRHILLFRISNLLMKIIGEKYATCLATIKMENGQFYSAFSALKNARLKLLDKCSLNKQDNEMIKKQLAQIDFYCWYFSVIAGKKIEDYYKNAFIKYCKDNKDPVANTYYRVLYMKELLIYLFEVLKRDSRIDENKMKSLQKEYCEFSKTIPHYSIHNAISKEWNFLNSSYNILNICHKISGEIGNNDKTELLKYDFYKLYSSLSLICNNKCILDDRTKKTRKTISAEYYVIELSCGAHIIFRGDYDRLKEAMSRNSIYVSSITAKAINEKNNIDVFKEDCANIIISIKNYDEDLEFIKKVYEHDSLVTDCVDRHMIYLDASNLCKEIGWKKKIQDDMSDLERNYPNTSSYFIVYDINKAFVLSSVFAMLEEHIQRLKSPIESYVISPVDKEDSYATQACDEISFATKELFYKTGKDALPNLGESFNLCFSSKTDKQLDAKVLLLDRIKEIKPMIDHLFYFIPGKNGICKAYSFDLYNTVLNDEKVYSDVCIIEGQNGKFNDLIVAINGLYNEFKNNSFYAKLHNSNLCEKEKCCNAFNTTDINNRQYKVLREYLYSYVGMVLPTKSFLLIKTKAQDGWLIISCIKDISETSQFKLCKSIEDVNNYLKNASEVKMHTCPNLSVTALENKIKPYTKDSKYFFISYRSNDKKYELCKPVYSNVIKLQEKFKKNLGFVIDVNSFKYRFREDIKKFTNDSLCIGAIMYLSFDFLCPIINKKGTSFELKKIEDDYCYTEALELCKRKEDPNFFILIVYIPTLNQFDNTYHRSFIDMINSAFKILIDKKDKERIECYKNLLNIKDIDYMDEIESVKVYLHNWDSNIKFCKDSNFKTYLKEQDIIV